MWERNSTDSPGKYDSGKRGLCRMKLFVQLERRDGRCILKDLGTCMACLSWKQEMRMECRQALIRGIGEIISRIQQVVPDA